MAYLLKTIQAILEANGYPIDIPLSAENTTKSHPYYYRLLTPHLTLEKLLQDTIDFVQHQGVTATRRVCFLLPNSSVQSGNYESLHSAVIVLCSMPQLLPDSVIKDLKGKTLNESIQLCSGVYRQVLVYFVGSIAQEVSTLPNHPILSLFQVAYGHQVRFQIQPIDPAPHANLVLTECILRILSIKSMDTIDSKQAYENHRKACANSVLKQLKAIEANDFVAYKKMTDHIRVLFKYIALRQIRGPVRLTQLTPAEQLTLQRRYPVQKQLIYSHPLIDLVSPIQALSIEPLVELLQAETIEHRLVYLQKERQEQLKELKNWEQQLFQLSPNWISQASQLGLQSWQHLYQYSLIGLGAELTPWLGKHAASWLSAFPTGQLLSETLTQWINPVYLLRGCQWLGGSLGVWGSYAVGGYWLGKSCLTGLIAQGLKSYFSQNTFDDVQAQIQQPNSYLANHLTRVRLAGFLIACLETLYIGTSQPLILALGGWIGSTSLVALAKQCVSDLKGAGTPQMTDNQAVALLFLGLAGYDIGRLIADYSYQGIDKQLAREHFNEVFCQLTEEKNFTGCMTDFTKQPTWSPGFWLNTLDQVKIGWTVNGTFHEADCEIIKLMNAERAILCEDPTNRPLLPLH